jgi:hypothetical protein
MPIVSVRKKNYNGITTKTVENLQLGAGAWFKNVSRNETYAAAKAAGKCLGATRGGGTFRAQAQIQQVEIDGAPGRVKGGIIVTGWEISMQTTLIESSTNALVMALGAADVDTTTMPGYDIIKGRMYADDVDFVNLCWMGCISGTSEPIKIFIKNAFNEGGLEYQTSDDGTGTIPLQLYGYNDLSEFMNDEVAPPFEIVRKQAEASTIPAVVATGGDEMINLTWAPITGATKYAVKSYASSEYTTIINDLTASWYTVTDLTADTEYSFLVQAYVNGAWSPAENADYNVTARTNPAAT